MSDTLQTTGAVDEAIGRLIFDPEARAHPYREYDILRSNDPVHRSEIGFWFATSYDACARLLKDPALARGHEDSWEIRSQLNNSTGRKWLAHQRRWMLWLDPPEHPKLRGLVSKAFTPRYIEKLRPLVDETIESLFDDMLEKGEADIIADLAFALPITIICAMLGVPSEDRHRFRSATVVMAQTLEPLPSDAVQDGADQAAELYESYFHDLIETRRRTPGDDLLSRLIEAEVDGEHLAEEEIIATATLLLGAGFETTTNLIGNGTLALLKNPGEWARLKASPQLARPAVEELLRYDSPVQLATPRVTTREIEVAGHTIPEKETVICVVGGANRDPARHQDPNALILDRDDPAPLSFGGGAHFCLGASLARLEGTAVFEAMAKRLPRMELNGPEPEWRPGLNLRGLVSLPVTL
jgi:cytochrome P450